MVSSYKNKLKKAYSAGANLSAASTSPLLYEVEQ
jgi:hypothetical protein